ncbi:MAG: hypothetical protein WC560_11130, partial [Syntrophales bacterium]
NSNGQLGNGTTTDSLFPVQVSGAGGAGLLSDVKAVAAGYGHTLALKNDGTVLAWGYNSNGQLGNGTTTDSLFPVQVSGAGGAGLLSDVKAVAAGYGHTLALKNDGTVLAWGYNSNGQLGNGTTTDSAVPIQLSGLSSVTAIVAGNYHCAALRYEITYIGVLAWGKNTNGQLGNGTTTDSAVPIQLSGLSSVTAVAAGNDHTAVLLSDGTLRAWGSNSNGQLGNGTTIDSAVPVQVSGLSSVTAVAAGNEDTFALRTDNSVWAWGNNSNGRLGNGTSTSYRSTPEQVQ